MIPVDKVSELELDYSGMRTIPDYGTVRSDTRRFINDFRRLIVRAPNRKQSQPQDILAEVWRVALNPNWLPPNRTFGFGLGNDQGFEVPPLNFPVV